MTKEKSVIRYNNGTIIKGYLKDFSPDQSEITLIVATTNRTLTVNIDELKAIFFVKSFEGDKEHKEIKTYGISKPSGQRVFIKFKDDESMVGFLEGNVPWDRGFFLSSKDKGIKGFFLLPVDLDSNNKKVFVVKSSVRDVTVVP